MTQTQNLDKIDMDDSIPKRFGSPGACVMIIEASSKGLFLSTSCVLMHFSSVHSLSFERELISIERGIEYFFTNAHILSISLV